jgi:hypothetical protein
MIFSLCWLCPVISLSLCGAARAEEPWWIYQFYLESFTLATNSSFLKKKTLTVGANCSQANGMYSAESLFATPTVGNRRKAFASMGQHICPMYEALLIRALLPS